jgi:hypothetical protein
VTKEERKEYNKRYYQLNKKKIDKKNAENLGRKEYLKQWREENKEKRKEYQSLWRKKNSHKQKEYLSEWRKNNPNYSTEYYRDNKDTQKKYRDKIKHIIVWRGILNSVLRRLGKEKNDETVKLLGYSPVEFKTHIESLFIEGMSWENHGEWHVDHIKPVSSFNKTTHPSVVNGLNNLQPLWALENLKKSNKCI